MRSRRLTSPPINDCNRTHQAQDAIPHTTSGRCVGASPSAAPCRRPSSVRIRASLHRLSYDAERDLAAPILGHPHSLPVVLSSAVGRRVVDQYRQPSAPPPTSGVGIALFRVSRGMGCG